MVVTVYVGAYCQEGGSRRALSEMELGQLGYIVGLFGYYEAVNLHIAGVGAAKSALKYAIHRLFVAGTLLEFANRAMVHHNVNRCHRNCFMLLVKDVLILW